MSCRRIEEQLDDWLDGTLAAGQRRRFDLHLEDCDACRRQVRSFEELLARAARLPRSLEPRRDLWPQLRRRLRSPRQVPAGGGRRGRRLRKLAAAVLGTAGLAAATLACLLRVGWLSSGLPSGAAARPAGAAAASRLAGGADGSLQGLEAALERTRAELLGNLSRLADDEGSAAMAVVEENFAVMEAAVEEIRLALRREPASPRLHRLLAASYRRELELLSKASWLAAPGVGAEAGQDL